VLQLIATSYQPQDLKIFSMVTMTLNLILKGRKVLANVNVIEHVQQLIGLL
jgi:hypothetical protein